MSAKSWPAEKTGPFAAKNTPRALLSPTLRKASVSSSICLSERAFRRFGLFIVIVAKSPSYCSSISSYGFCSSIDIGCLLSGRCLLAASLSQAHQELSLYTPVHSKRRENAHHVSFCTIHQEQPRVQLNECLLFPQLTFRSSAVILKYTTI